MLTFVEDRPVFVSACTIVRQYSSVQCLTMDGTHVVERSLHLCDQSCDERASFEEASRHPFYDRCRFGSLTSHGHRADENVLI